MSISRKTSNSSAGKTSFLHQPSHLGSMTIRLLRNNVIPKLETGLQKEIQEEEEKRDSHDAGRLRAQVRRILTSRFVLFTVVVFCFIDCIMVIGELLLDMHAIKASNASEINPPYNSERHLSENVTADKHARNTDTSDNDLTKKIAHAFHYTSLTILSILMVETSIKIAAFGRKFLDKKFEVFDAFVVFVSFIIDIVFLNGLMDKPLRESAFTLSFLLPWRVIRVVNSMIVALLHREHIKLLLVFKSKQYLAKQIDEISNDLVLLQKQLAALKDLCRNEGVEDWRINQCVGAVLTESSMKKNALTSLASISLGGFMNARNAFMADSKDAMSKFLPRKGTHDRETSTTNLLSLSEPAAEPLLPQSRFSTTNSPESHKETSAEYCLNNNSADDGNWNENVDYDEADANSDSGVIPPVTRSIENRSFLTNIKRFSKSWRKHHKVNFQLPSQFQNDAAPFHTVCKLSDGHPNDIPKSSSTPEVYTASALCTNADNSTPTDQNNLYRRCNSAVFAPIANPIDI